jgi:uncharacterized protein
LHIDTDLYYWTAENGTAEVNFLIQHKGETIPIEVKAEENLKAKSLKLFVERYENKNAIRISMSEYRVGEWVTNVPLYGVNGVVG